MPVTQAESMGFRTASPDYPPSYRNNDRLVVDDIALADRLYKRLASIAPCPISTPAIGHSENWHMDGVNNRMRFCRYTRNQQFNIHQDGVHHHRVPDWRSMLTFMIYLNDGSEFSGGDTQRSTGHGFGGHISSHLIRIAAQAARMRKRLPSTFGADSHDNITSVDSSVVAAGLIATRQRTV